MQRRRKRILSTQTRVPYTEAELGNCISCHSAEYNSKKPGKVKYGNLKESFIPSPSSQVQIEEMS